MIQNINYQIKNFLTARSIANSFIADILLPQASKQALLQNEKTITTFKLIELLQKQRQKLPKCVIYVQQIELFFNHYKQTLTQDFFDIFANKHLKIVLLGISNTIDALEKYGKKLNIKINEVTNIVFNPYTIDQLKQIIIDKLQQVRKTAGIKINYEDRMIKFIANKISESKKADMRTVFQFLKNLSHNLFTKQITPQETTQNTQNPKQAINEYELTYDIISYCLSPNSSKAHLIKALPFNCQIVLIAAQSYILQFEQISITEEQLIKKMNFIYSVIGLDSKRDINKQVLYLEDYGMITKKQTKGVVKYLLNISTNDIKNVFQNHAVLAKFV